LPGYKWRFVKESRERGTCFVRDEDHGVVIDLVRAFMTGYLNMSDEAFMNECKANVTKMMLAKLRALNNKVAATYRKKLTNCELLVVSC
jgi:hypothetical protein